MTDGGVYITRDLLAICIYQHLVYYRPKARFEAILYIFTKVLKRHNVCFFLISDSTEREIIGHCVSGLQTLELNLY